MCGNKTTDMGKYCIIMIFPEWLCSLQHFSLFRREIILEKVLMALLVKTWFTCFNSVQKTELSSKNFNTEKKSFFFFLSILLPVIGFFYTLYSSTQCLLFESCKNRVKQGRAENIFSPAGFGVSGRDGEVAGEGSAVGTAGFSFLQLLDVALGIDILLLWTPVFMLFWREKWVQM